MKGEIKLERLGRLYCYLLIVTLLITACDLAPVPQQLQPSVVPTSQVAGINTIVVAPPDYLATVFPTITVTVEISPTSSMEALLTPTGVSR